MKAAKLIGPSAAMRARSRAPRLGGSLGLGLRA
jgi:hypothetical protein